jgi:hypothetical protein
MDKFPLTSKAVWAAILIAIASLYGYFMGEMGTVETIMGLAMGLLGYGLRDAL